NTKIIKIDTNNKILKISGPLLFGLTLLSIKNVCQILALNYNLKIHPFEDLNYIKIKWVQFEIEDEQFDISFRKVDEK
ncbi:2273_t:CDS:2, partial [Racocetra fulgida]